ncbi:MULTISPECIES: hypothetical protein [unclassified Streptomyces]|uniref:hypothetical protein n=1 Tax=unclassified Streptomyces TaxID=2593676 RepID=UPI0022587F0F|nr:hypothetical protein [Streptomyces sp. NBC_00047]MCX5610047.1 hypothetical protein [Streptomyces sp. NBC_00047]
MVEQVLAIFTQMAGGTAAVVGAEVGHAVSAIVRDRLGTTEQGRAAISTVETSPTDPAAVEQLRDLVESEMAADPRFAERIALALAGPPPASAPRINTGISFDNSPVRGRPIISMAGVTVSNTRNVRFSLLAAALVLVALLALGLYGGTQLFNGDDSPAQGGAGSQNSATAIKDAALAKTIPPGMDSLPTGWSVGSGYPKEFRCGGMPAKCRDALLDIQTSYTPGFYFDQAQIEVVTYPSVEAATVGYAEIKRENADFGSTPTPVAMSNTGGDESAAVEWANSPTPGITEATGAFAVVRVGTVVINVVMMDEGAGGTDLGILQSFAATATARAQQAQNGQAPSAVMTK